MKTNINPSALYWASFNRFELRLPGEAVIARSAIARATGESEVQA